MSQEQVGASERKLLSVAALAAEVGISQMSLYRLIRAGELPAVRMGHRIFVPARVVDQLGDAAMASGGTVSAAELFGGAS